MSQVLDNVYSPQVPHMEPGEWWRGDLCSLRIRHWRYVTRCYGRDGFNWTHVRLLSWIYLFYLSVRVGCAVTETWEWNMTRGLLVFLLIEISVLNLTIVWSKLKWFISFNDKTKYFQLPSWNFCQDLLQSKQYWYCYSRSIDKGWKASGLWNRHHNKTNRS